MCIRDSVGSEMCIRDRAPALQRRDFIADDPVVAQACRLVEAAVKMQVPLLFQGETGTGKEVMARFAHERSGRTGAFIAVNCAAVPPDLFEAELFGYVGGAYTGARREGSPGLIVAAHGGTLLLDEVRELPLQLQAALLRFLDDREVRAVGGQGSRRVDVQLMAATHADLEAEVRNKTFREDLMYRLNTVRIGLPPLRERADFATLVQQMLLGLDERSSITQAAVECLATHNWPGNMRELRTVLTRALLVRSLDPQQRPLDAPDVQAVLPLKTDSTMDAAEPPAGSRLQRRISELVRAEFERNGGCVSQTSRALGISRTTVYRHLKS
jgi:transcriptional regulator with PAS, ATPase and Fis domain